MPLLGFGYTRMLMFAKVLSSIPRAAGVQTNETVSMGETLVGAIL